MKQFLIFWFLLSSMQIFACKCADRGISIDIERYEFIFSATINSKEVLNTKAKYHASTEMFWKGSKNQKVIFYSGTGGPDCGFRFEVGKTYVIWAYMGKNGALQTSRCSRTTLLKNSADIDYLNYFFKSYDYSKTKLTSNEIRVIADKFNINEFEIRNVKLFYFEEKLITKIDFLDKISNFNYKLSHIKFDKTELTKLPDIAKYGMIIILNYNERKNKRKRIMKKIIKVSG